MAAKKKPAAIIIMHDDMPPLRKHPQHVELQRKVANAINILVEGLKYHEHDGHDMPKRVAREALVALGVPMDDQPGLATTPSVGYCNDSACGGCHRMGH